MTSFQFALAVLSVAAGCTLTRILPFLLFSARREPPRVIAYLGRVLPAASMGLLVIYCLKDLSLTAAPYGLPELIAVAATVLLQLWRRNSLVSIAGGTALFMLLVNFVF